MLFISPERLYARPTAGRDSGPSELHRTCTRYEQVAPRERVRYKGTSSGVRYMGT